MQQIYHVQINFFHIFVRFKKKTIRPICKYSRSHSAANQQNRVNSWVKILVKTINWSILCIYAIKRSFFFTFSFSRSTHNVITQHMKSKSPFDFNKLLSMFYWQFVVCVWQMGLHLFVKCSCSLAMRWMWIRSHQVICDSHHHCLSTECVRKQKSQRQLSQNNALLTNETMYGWNDDFIYITSVINIAYHNNNLSFRCKIDLQSLFSIQLYQC